jgi:hypothetical protein
VFRGVDEKSLVSRSCSQTKLLLGLLLNTSAYASPLVLATMSKVRQHRQSVICSQPARTVQDGQICSTVARLCREHANHYISTESVCNQRSGVSRGRRVRLCGPPLKQFNGVVACLAPEDEPTAPVGGSSGIYAARMGLPNGAPCIPSRGLRGLTSQEPSTCSPTYRIGPPSSTVMRCVDTRFPPNSPIGPRTPYLLIESVMS